MIGEKTLTRQVQLDWRAYYNEFCAMHGGNPVVYRGRLLFADGYTHSSTDYAGPEWRPPTEPDALKELKLAYWSRRSIIVTAERDDKLRDLQALIELQYGKSASLQHQITTWDEESKTVKVSRLTNEEAMQGIHARLQWLEQDVLDCQKKIEELANRGNAVGLGGIVR